MDLNAPLGKTPPPKGGDRASGGGAAGWRRRRPILIGAGALVAVAALVALGATLWTADPHGGEPYVVASIPPREAKPAPAPKPAPLDPVTTGSIPPGFANAPAAPFPPAHAAQGAGTPLIIDVAKVLAEREHGAASAAGDGGTMPPAAQPAADVKPRIAIFVSGMGLPGPAIRTAIELMPSAVTLAFMPYGEGVPAAVASARERGHEILLQVPMQNAGGAPLPGPHALQANEPTPQVEVDVAWLMGRIDGYDGVVNALGAPVTADRNVMGALLRAVAARGLFYVDDGTSRRSLAQAVALAQGTQALRADVVLDATADPAVVHANLEALVAVAKHKGSAIGMASGLPDHLAAIAAFAAGLSGRGVDLVPVSALAGRMTRTVAK